MVPLWTGLSFKRYGEMKMFLDRADIVQYIGPPNQTAIYQILFSAIQVHQELKVFS